MNSHKLYFTKNILSKINDISYYTQIEKNYKRLHSLELLKIKGAYIDSNGYFRCKNDMPFIDIPLILNKKINVYKLYDKDDVLKEIYVNSEIPIFCTVFVYSSINEEVIIAQGNTDIHNHLPIFTEGLPLLQYGRNIYVRCDKQPIGRFIQLDNESRYDITTYRRNKKDGCKLLHKSNVSAEILNVNDYGCYNNDLHFIS